MMIVPTILLHDHDEIRQFYSDFIYYPTHCINEKFCSSEMKNFFLNSSPYFTKVTV